MNEDEREQKIKTLIFCGLSPREAREHVKRDEEIESNRAKREPVEETEPEEEDEEEETEDPTPTRQEIIKDVQESVIRQKKMELLDKIEEQLEESEKSDGEIAELKKQLIDQVKLNSFWFSVLENKRWESILRNYFGIVHGMTNKMCAKAVVTVTESNGQIHFTYEFFDSKGRPVATQFNDVYGDES